MRSVPLNVKERKCIANDCRANAAAPGVGIYKSGYWHCRCAGSVDPLLSTRSAHRKCTSPLCVHQLLAHVVRELIAETRVLVTQPQSWIFLLSRQQRIRWDRSRPLDGGPTKSSPVPGCCSAPERYLMKPKGVVCQLSWTPIIFWIGKCNFVPLSS